MKNALDVKSLTTGYWTNFKCQTILKGLSLKLSEAKSYFLLGENGAGKTTLIKTILGFIPLYKGEISVYDKNIKNSKREYLRKIGYVPEADILPSNLTAIDFLTIYNALLFESKKRMSKSIHESLSKVELTEYKNVKIENYSKGMKKRLMIANAMVNEPDFFILDEPFEGLDPRQRRKLKNLINEYKKSGKTILISSHEIFEFKDLCEYAIFLRDGTVSYFGLVDNINIHNSFNLKNEK